MLGKNRVQERVDEWLSAYIDGALSPREQARLEAQLAQDADLRARLESLRRTVALVRGMPSVPAPRNFLLTPAMVRRPAPVVRRLAPALTFATAISGLLCVILLVGNLIAAGPRGLGTAAPAPMIASEGTPQALEAPFPEEGLLSGAATATEAPAPEMRAWSEGTPSPVEAAPSPQDMGGGAATEPPLGERPEPGEEILGSGGGAGPRPIWGLGERAESGEEILPAQMPEMTPSEGMGGAAEETTPVATAVTEPTPTPVPLETPGEQPTSPPVPWLSVGGLALLTAVLAVLSLRAWRAR